MQANGDAAIAAASRLLERHGLRWCEVLESVSVAVIRAQDTPRGDHDDSSDSDPFHGRDWREIATRCRQFRNLIDAWEEQFLERLPQFRRLSPKQYNKLISIVARLRAMGCRP